MYTPPFEFWKLFKETSGALSTSESLAIMNLAALAPEGDCCELGVYKGKSAMSAICGLKGERDFYLIEPEFNDLNFLRETTNNINTAKRLVDSDIINFYRATYSTDFLPKEGNPFAYVMVDSGSHGDGLPMSEAKLLEDIMLAGGIIVWHDWNSQFTEIKEATDYLVSTEKYEYVHINWEEIKAYVAEHDLEKDNSSWHHVDNPFPCFVGAVRRK